MAIGVGELESLIFRNYQPIDTDSFAKNVETLEELKHVHELEENYQKKVKNTIKKYLKNEDDPLSGLIPKKANIDLKRNLNMKLEKLEIQTERAILEIMSKLR